MTQRSRNTTHSKRLIYARLACFLCLAISNSLAQSRPRLAILELIGDEKDSWTALIREAAQNSPFELLDADLVRAAARGSGFSGNLNLSREEARALGQSLGSDFFLLGKIQVARRLGAGEQFYFDALIGIFVVETRTGKLIRFIFERAEAPTENEATQKLKDLIKIGWDRSAEAMTHATLKRAQDLERPAPPPGPAIELLTDDAPAQGMNGPVFYQRLKPVYPEQAELAGIVAVVELEAVFGADGKVGEVEIVRWAGFGLDESAVRTVRLLQFKPAEREGKKVTIRGLVRYNFRRPLTQAAQPRAQSREETERLKRSLQEILNPGSKPGLKP
jgi:TonB family protein